MGEPPKDFLALTHGEEWVNFYESFDKLVQDNLSRSSDLLKRAMTLPEVADREVARVKDEHQAKLVIEQDRQRAVLTDLREEVANSQRQLSTLTRGMGSLLADLEGLSGRITSALGAVGVDPDPVVDTASVEPQVESLAAVPKSQTAPLVGVEKAATGLVGAAKAATGLVGAAKAATGLVGAAKATTGLVGAAKATTGLVGAAKPATGLLAAAAAEEAAQAAADAQASVDLIALAEAETEKPAEPELVVATTGAAERQRPHWLSVTRPNSTN